MLRIIILGVLIGVGISIFPGTMIALGLFAAFLAYILKAEPFARDRKFIVKIVLIGFVLRLLFILCYYHMYLNQGKPDMLGPDGEVYLERGWYISQVLLGKDPYAVPSNEYSFTYHAAVVKLYKESLPHVGKYQIGPYSYFIGFLFAAFGYDPVMIKLLNVLACMLSAVIVYLIGRECFGDKVARAAITCFIFLPSVFIHSVTALRDPFVILILVSFVWCLVLLNMRRKVIFFFLAVISAVAAGILRSETLPALLIVMVAVVLFGAKISAISKISAAVILIFIIQGLHHQGIFVIHEEIKKLFIRHIGYAMSHGNNYRVLPEQFYSEGSLNNFARKDFVLGMLNGVFHLLYEPLPNRVSNFSNFLAFLQTIFMYLLMPFVFLGGILGMRLKFSAVLPLVVYLFIFIFLLAMTEGNVGTVFRHRDMLMPFFIILGAGWLCAKIKLKDRSRVTL